MKSLNEFLNESNKWKQYTIKSLLNTPTWKDEVFLDDESDDVKTAVANTWVDLNNFIKDFDIIKSNPSSFTIAGIKGNKSFGISMEDEEGEIYLTCFIGDKDMDLQSALANDLSKNQYISKHEFSYSYDDVDSIKSANKDIITLLNKNFK